MFWLLLTVACSSEGDKEHWGTWEGDPRDAVELSDQLEVGEESAIRIKLFEQDGVTVADVRLQGEIRYSIFTLDEGTSAYEEAEGVELEGDEVRMDYSYKILDFEIWGAFIGDDQALILHADQHKVDGPEMLFRGLPLQRTDVDMDEQDTGN